MSDMSRTLTAAIAAKNESERQRDMAILRAAELEAELSLARAELRSALARGTRNGQHGTGEKAA